eukprot:11703526-Prorocentrum_lima.AAC.1
MRSTRAIAQVATGIVWKAPRVMSLHSLVHPVAYYSSRGLPAGDIFNDIFVQLYCVDAYAVYVDDNTMTYQE